MTKAMAQLLQDLLGYKTGGEQYGCTVPPHATVIAMGPVQHRAARELASLGIVTVEPWKQAPQSSNFLQVRLAHPSHHQG